MDKIVDKYIILFLQTVKSNGSVSLLLKSGLEYSQIARISAFALDLGYVEIKDEQTIITSKGLKFYNKLNYKYNLKGINKWLSPLFERKINIINKEDIFIPALESIKYKR